jgi:alkylglycerol monooxygenase
MDGKYIAAAVPFFFLLIGIELLVNRRRGDPRYVFADSITNLSCGIGQQIIGVLVRAVPLLLYVYLYDHARLHTFSLRSPLAWVLILFLVDLCYWAYHWASHRVNFLWATHIVHHQSEEYNLTVALRQSWFAQTMSWFFYLPLAVLGFPPVMYVTMLTLNTLYQFWIHTRAVGTLGPLEWFLNTPSHHRVHHGIDPAYIDKNYAGIFIIWDRLFRTFTRERGEPVYGTVTPLSSWNPLWANVEHWVKMWRMSRQTRRLGDKVRVWLKGPEWRPADLGGPVVIPPVSRAGQRKYAAAAPRPVATYVLVQFAAVLVAATLFLVVAGTAPRPAMLTLAAAVLAGLVSLPGLLEGRPYALPLEALRLALSAVAAGLFFPPPAGALGGAVLALASLAWALAAARHPQDAVTPCGPAPSASPQV